MLSWMHLRQHMNHHLSTLNMSASKAENLRLHGHWPNSAKHQRNQEHILEARADKLAARLLPCPSEQLFRDLSSQPQADCQYLRSCWLKEVFAIHTLSDVVVWLSYM